MKYIDYHIHATTDFAARRHLEMLYYQFKGIKNRPELSFSNHSSLEIYNYPLNDLAKRFNIKLIPSFSIISEEGDEFLIKNPGKEEKKLVDEFCIERMLRIKHILEILGEYKLFIHINDIKERTGKTFSDITDIDIAEELVLNGYYNDLEQCYKYCFNFIDIPHLFWNTDKILDVFGRLNSEIILIHPEHSPLLVSDNRIKGFIYSNKIPSEILVFLTTLHKSKNFFPGTGIVI